MKGEYREFSRMYLGDVLIKIGKEDIEGALHSLDLVKDCLLAVLNDVPFHEKEDKGLNA